MALRWVDGPGGDGLSRWALDDEQYLVARVIWYGAPVPHWVAILVQERLEGTHATAEEAMAAAEQEHAERTPRGAPDGPGAWRRVANRPD